MTPIIVIAVIALLVLWFIGSQRRLVKLDEMCKNAMSQIGVQQNSRWDALNSLADVVKQYDDHEYSTLIDVIKQRQTINGGSTATQADAQENIITQAMGKIMAIAEAYPNLKANENYAKIMDSVNQHEQNVRLSRMTCNDTITKYNQALRQIPVCFIAGMLGFVTREYLQTPTEKQERPTLTRNSASATSTTPEAPVVSETPVDQTATEQDAPPAPPTVG